MFACFHSKETSPSSYDDLNTVASGTLIYFKMFNNNLGGIRPLQVNLYTVYS